MENQKFEQNQSVRVDFLVDIADKANRESARKNGLKLTGKVLASERVALVNEYVDSCQGDVEGGLSLFCADLHKMFVLYGSDIHDKEAKKRTKETAMRSFKRAVEASTDKLYTIISNGYAPRWEEKAVKVEKDISQQLSDLVAGLVTPVALENILCEFHMGVADVKEEIAQYEAKRAQIKASAWTDHVKALFAKKGKTATEEEINSTIDSLKMAGYTV